jgi:hypothetical protein
MALIIFWRALCDALPPTIFNNTDFKPDSHSHLQKRTMSVARYPSLAVRREERQHADEEGMPRQSTRRIRSTRLVKIGHNLRLSDFRCVGFPHSFGGSSCWRSSKDASTIPRSLPHIARILSGTVQQVTTYIMSIAVFASNSLLAEQRMALENVDLFYNVLEDHRQFDR